MQNAKRRDRWKTAGILILAAGLFEGCGGVGGTGDKIPLVANCGVTQAALTGTWKVATRNQTVTCSPAGTLHTTGATNTYTNVTATPSLEGFEVKGTGFAATVDADTCHISYSFVDRDTGALLSCFCTFFPATSTVGAGVDDAHCYGAKVDANRDGTPDTNCEIPEPYLDSFITLVVQ